MKKLCRQLGREYSIIMLDLEQVIYRNFGNGYDVEISGINTSSEKKKATIYLWRCGRRIIDTVHDVPQSEIHERVEELYHMTLEWVREVQ